MTNAVVWKLADAGTIWAAADSRVSIPKSEESTNVRRVTDQAMKVLRLKVTAHDRTCYIPAVYPALEMELGLVYAGAVVPALLTHAAASVMLENLHPQEAGKQITLPRLVDVANLIRHLSERYIRDAAVAYQTNQPPYCEFVLFGIDTEDHLQDKNDMTAYRIRPRSTNPNALFEQIVEHVDLGKGEMAIVGADTEALREEITEVVKLDCPAWRGVEPRIALEKRMLAGQHDTVGGTLQFGILDRNKLELYGAAVDSTGQANQNWLGFDCQNEISGIIGMPVVITAMR